MSLFQLGNFTLASGVPSKFKIECDALTTDDVDTLAYLLSLQFPDGFGEVCGVPRGGLRIAEAIKQYSTDGWLLIVDDVWTTGRSMRDVVFDMYKSGLLPPRYYGGVFFSRTELIPGWIKSVFTMRDVECF